MDYTLLTAAHLGQNKSAKMDAKREQAYYESATETSRKLEGLLETAVFPVSLAKQALALARRGPTRLALHFSFGWKARKSLS
jgi:hypothetical protein